MALSKAVNTILSNKTAAASSATASTDCTTITTTALVNLAVECKVTYNAAATLGVTVKLFSSYDDTNYDTQPYDQFTMPFTANTTVSKTFSLNPAPKYLKAVVANLDAGQSATAIYVYSHEQSA